MTICVFIEPVSADLRASIGERFGFTAANVIIGNGSDNILDLITRCFVSDPGAGHTVPSYSLYPVVAGMSGQNLKAVEFDRSMRLDIAALASTEATVFSYESQCAHRCCLLARNRSCFTGD